MLKNFEEITCNLPSWHQLSTFKKSSYRSYIRISPPRIATESSNFTQVRNVGKGKEGDHDSGMRKKSNEKKEKRFLPLFWNDERVEKSR